MSFISTASLAVLMSAIQNWIWVVGVWEVGQRYSMPKPKREIQSMSMCERSEVREKVILFHQSVSQLMCLVFPLNENNSWEWNWGIYYCEWTERGRAMERRHTPYTSTYTYTYTPTLGSALTQWGFHQKVGRLSNPSLVQTQEVSQPVSQSAKPNQAG